jgi:hypothetical protein
MKIIARISSTCRCCKGHIRAGQVIDWERGIGSTHAQCPPVLETVPLLPKEMARAAFQLIEGIATMADRRRRPR